MDDDAIVLIAIGVLGAIGIIWAGFRLDRRSQRIQSAKWMTNWSIRTRVLAELFRRWQGPLRLQDHRPVATPPATGKRKAATRRRKRSRNASR